MYLNHYVIQILIFYTVIDPHGVTTYLTEYGLKQNWSKEKRKFTIKINVCLKKFPFKLQKKNNIMLIIIIFLSALDKNDISHLLNINKYWI